MHQQNHAAEATTRGTLALGAVFAVGWLAGCASPQPAPTQSNRELVRTYFEEWANRGDPSVADRVISPNLVLWNPPSVLRSLDEYKRSMASFHHGFPDLRFTIEEEVAENDKVVVRWTLRGTQTGGFAGHPPSGKACTVTGMSLFRIADGRIQEIHVNMDRLGLFQQLGWVPEPIPAPSQPSR